VSLPPVVITLAVLGGSVAASLSTGCDQLNRPLGSPSSSSSSSGGASPGHGDAGEDGGLLVPTFSPQPGDIQL
jgi:hypothetical protein